MTLFQDTGSDPRAARSALADVLTWYGAVGDAVLGHPSGFALRKAAVATSIARIAEVAQNEIDALAFAGMLHAIGAIGNRAFRRGDPLPERMARMERWDVPAQGAMCCAQIAALPPETADLVRWQAEAWDGTGYPDQLRWHGIPKSAQILHLAGRYASAADPDEMLGTIGLDAGRSFGPEHVRAFTMWFHLHGGEADALVIPCDALRAEPGDAQRVLETVADRVDAHVGSEGRWQRIDALAQATAAGLGLDTDARRTLALACRIFGAGEIGSEGGEDFDPLARLGVETRARESAQAAAFASAIPTLQAAAAIVAARAEWFDGSGRPNGAAREAIPVQSRILAAAIACERLDRRERIDTASGTQFDPAVVRALMSTSRA